MSTSWSDYEHLVDLWLTTDQQRLKVYIAFHIFAVAPPVPLWALHMNGTGYQHHRRNHGREAICFAKHVTLGSYHRKRVEIVEYLGQPIDDLGEELLADTD